MFVFVFVFYAVVDVIVLLLLLSLLLQLLMSLFVVWFPAPAILVQMYFAIVFFCYSIFLSLSF